jgi:hypothetical protein
VVRLLEKRLGALPVVAEFGRRLRIAEIVDELCPVRPVALISHGEVIEALVANRLTAPAPMLRVHEWAAAMAVDEAYGITPQLLNDDRIARALDAVAPCLDEITGSVGAAAITEFGVDVSRLHWDLTSISLYGAYPQADLEYPAPRWGHPRDRRPDLRQIQAGLAVSGDGGIPVFHHAYAGGAAEVAQVVGAMTALRQIAGPRPLHERGGDGRPAGGVYRAAGRGPGPGGVIRRAAAGGGHAGGLYVAARVTAIATRRRVKAYLRTVITQDATGRPVLSWHFDQAAIDAEAATDGWYALLANLDLDQAGPAEVFRRYKGQHVVERRYGEFKGPLAVAPLFLKTNRRIAALITVICLALLIFCLAERQVRNALRPHGGMMTGLPGYRTIAARPTGRTIFQALSDLRLIPADDGNPAMIPKPTGVQARLLDLLGIDISRPRWLTK